MNVILTGATGYLGKRILEKLVCDDFNILCIKRDLSSLCTIVRMVEKTLWVDSNDPELEKVIRNFHADVVVHMACKYEGDSYHNEADRIDQLIDANLLFPLKLLGIAVDNKISKWINTCTTLPKFLNVYSKSKWQFAEWGDFFANKFGIDFLNVKLENFYGENEVPTKFIPMLINKMKRNEKILLTDGLQHRDFIYLNDVISAYMLLLNSNLKGYTDIALGSGEAPSIREIVTFLHEHLHSHSELVFGAISKRENEPEITVADTSLLKSLGWNCNFNWKTGLEKIIETIDGGN